MQTDTRENILFVRLFSISCWRMIFRRNCFGIFRDSSRSMWEWNILENLFSKFSYRQGIRATRKRRNKKNENISAVDVLPSLFFFSGWWKENGGQLLILRPHKLICKAARSISSLPLRVFYPRRTGNLKRKQKYKARRARILTEVSRDFLSTWPKTKKCLPF